MRIDKLLWCLRYFKTRSIATNACKKGAVKINNNPVKPSKDVYPGDQVVVRIQQIRYQFILLDAPKSRVGPKLVDQYRKDTTPKESFENLEFLNYSKDYYRKRGTGRPSKKERRDLEDFSRTNEEE